MRGTVIKSKYGYAIKYDLGKTIEGKRLQKWEGGYKTRKQAEKVLRTRINEVESTNNKNLIMQDISSYMDRWLEEKCKPMLAINTYRGYKVNVEKHIKPYIGKILMTKLVHDDVERLYKALSEKGLSNTSIIYVHRVLKKSLNDAVKKGYIGNNVCNQIEPPRKKGYKAVVYNAEQLKTLIQACEGTGAYIPVILAIVLGLRRGEALGLKWTDIDWDRQSVTVVRSAIYVDGKMQLSDTKTVNGKRTLVMSDKLTSILKNCYKEREEENEMICVYNGKWMTSNVLQKEFKKCVEKSGQADIRFHDLRHANATMYLRNNVPMKVVSAMLGHSGIGITMDTYSHMQTDMQEQVKGIFDGVI